MKCTSHSWDNDWRMRRPAQFINDDGYVAIPLDFCKEPILAEDVIVARKEEEEEEDDDDDEDEDCEVSRKTMTRGKQNYGQKDKGAR